jgi:hypothetical protein
MAYVVSSYIAVFGTIGLYAARVLLRARRAAASVSVAAAAAANERAGAEAP